jgi:hypothetical protein
MNDNPHRISRPVYELLPFLYIGVGLPGFLGAWLMAGSLWSDVSLLLGVAGVVVGLVILLRRRDYRTNKERYNSASLKDQ